MNRCAAILTVLLSSWFYSGVAQSQDSLVARRNTVSVDVLSPLGGVLSVSYARQFRNGNEFILNPRIAFANPTPGPNKRPFGLGINEDPQSYYDEYKLRTGIVVYLKGGFAYEPHLQFEHASFYNKVLITEDHTGESQDQSVRMDRKYFSSGLINMISWTRDRNRLRIKFYLGIGVHVRRYQQKNYELLLYRRSVVYPESIISEYSKSIVRPHTGIEFGFRF